MFPMAFEIPRKLPSLNQVIEKNRENRYVGAKYKATIEDAIKYDIILAKAKRMIKPIKEPCIVRIEWHESTMRRDVDNIQSSQKFILDALQSTGILINDNRRYVKQVYHEIIDDERDYVRVQFESVPPKNS